MEQIIEQYGKAIMIFVAIILLIGIIVVATSGSEGVFTNLINSFYNKATSAGNISCSFGLGGFLR